MRPSEPGTCRAVAWLVLLAVPHGRAFLCPTGIDVAARVGYVGMMQGCPRLVVCSEPRAIGTRMMALTGEEGEESGGRWHGIAPEERDASNASTTGPLRSVRSLFSGKAAMAAAASALLSAGGAGRAEAFWGRGKSVDVPASPAYEQQVEEVSEVISEMATAGLMDTTEQGEEGDLGAESTPGTASPDQVTNVAEDETGETEGSVPYPPMPLSGFDEEGAAEEESPEGSIQSQELERSGPLEAVRRTVTENPKVALVAIVGAAGASFAVSRGSEGVGGGRRRQRERQPYGRSRSAAARASSRSPVAAPRSPSAGIGRPRVSPEVAEADSKRAEESLKSATFDVDEELFDGAVGNLPVKPSEDVREAVISSAKTTEETSAGSTATSTSSATEATNSVTAAADSATEAATAEVAAEPPPVEAPAEPALAPPPTEQQEKPKRRGPMMNLFSKRDEGPQRATTLEEALSSESPDVANFRQATAAVLTRSAPMGLFVVKEPTVLEEAAITPVEGEGLAAENAASISRIQALKQLMLSADLSTAGAAECIADIVNAMVIRLVDDAVNAKDDQATSDASDALLSYMDGAGALFATLCPGEELKPPIRYKGSSKRGKLERVFETAAKKALKAGDEGQMSKLDRLQDLLSIKEAKASSITQKTMMDLMMKMMSEGGGGEDTEGLEKMMAAMGAGEMGGMPGMGAGKSPEEMKEEMEALKEMVESGECPREEVDSLRKMYKDAGMDIDQLVNDPLMEASMDSSSKEVVVLLRKLLALHPK